MKKRRKINNSIRLLDRVPNQREDILNRALPMQQHLLRALPKKTLVAEYERIRGIARGEIAALRESRFRNSEQAMYYSKKFRAQGKYLTKRQLAMNLIDLDYFFRNPLTTIKGQEERERRTIASLNETFDTDLFSNQAFFIKFTRVMDKVRNKYQNFYSSSMADEVFNLIKEGVRDSEIVKLVEQSIVDDLYDL